MQRNDNRFNLIRNLLIIGPMAGYMVVSVAQAELGVNEMVNAGLVIAAAIIGGIVILGGWGSIKEQTETQLPPPPDNCESERDQLRVEVANLRGQVKAMNQVFDYLNIQVTVRR